MSRTKKTSTLVWLLLLAGCGDALGPQRQPPGGDGPRLSTELRTLRQAHRPKIHTGGTDGVSFSTSATTVVAPALETYETGFWAVNGQTRSVGIAYENGQPFLDLEVPPNALAERPDGTGFAAGDSVFITLSVDTSLLLVQLEPSGLVFDADTPARLRFHYGLADPDYNSDGAVDQADEQIESDELGIWVQQDQDDPWFRNAAAHSITEKWFDGFLYHFSNYSVSW